MIETIVREVVGSNPERPAGSSGVHSSPYENPGASFRTVSVQAEIERWVMEAKPL